METIRVNEDTVSGNYVLEMYNTDKKEWEYLLTEYSISVCSNIMVNIHNATNKKLRVLSRRSKNMVIASTH